MAQLAGWRVKGKNGGVVETNLRGKGHFYIHTPNIEGARMISWSAHESVQSAWAVARARARF